MVLKLVFTKNNPLNTVLVDKTSGQVMYEVETERRFLSKTTVIRKPFTSASSLFFFVFCFAFSAIDSGLIDRRGKSVPNTATEVAKIQWKTFSSDRIVYYGCSMKRGEFLPKAGLFTEWVYTIPVRTPPCPTH